MYNVAIGVKIVHWEANGVSRSKVHGQWLRFVIKTCWVVLFEEGHKKT